MTDPFGEGAYLRSKNVGGSIVVYSVFPDRNDQNAMVEYDPTNGTISSGDMTLRID